MQILFPASYNRTSEWLRDVVDEAEEALFEGQQQLLAVLEEHAGFNKLAERCVVRALLDRTSSRPASEPTVSVCCAQLRARTKSLFSIMKKLLRLDELAKGGRRKEEIYDVLGMRAIVFPRSDLPPTEVHVQEPFFDLPLESSHAAILCGSERFLSLHVAPDRSTPFSQAEARAVEACYVVKNVAESLWMPLSGRTKDYISQPKENGYQSIHLSLRLRPKESGPGRPAPTASIDDSEAFPPCMELQIRTQRMDELAEAGEASHSS